MMRRRIAGVAVLALLPLSGCGGTSYCADLETNRRALADMVAAESPSALLSNLPLLRDLAEDAPEDLADEWRVFLAAVEGLDQALSDAGVEPADFEGGQPPADLSEAEQQAIAEAADNIASDKVVAAASGIEQQARDVCKVNIGV